jgi:hypothetical protein
VRTANQRAADRTYRLEHGEEIAANQHRKRKQVNRELEMIRVHRSDFRVPVPGDPWIVMSDRGTVGRWVVIWP